MNKNLIVKTLQSPSGFLRVSNLTKDYNSATRALDCVNLNIDRGEWVSVMGPSSSGKTPLRWTNLMPLTFLTHIGTIWNTTSGICCSTAVFGCLLPPVSIGSSVPTTEYMCKQKANSL